MHLILQEKKRNQRANIFEIVKKLENILFNFMSYEKFLNFTKFYAYSYKLREYMVSFIKIN